MKKTDQSKPLYTPPQVFRLDEHKSVFGGDCQDGTSDTSFCDAGNNADNFCLDGNSADRCFSSGSGAAETISFCLPDGAGPSFL